MSIPVPPNPRNPFKELPELDAKAPERLREKVVGTYSFISHAFKIIDLYLGNFFGTIGELINLRQQKGPEDESKDKTPP